MIATATSAVRYGYTDTPIGSLLLTGSEDALTGVYVDGHARTPALEPTWERDDGGLDGARAQLDEYFAGTRTGFDVPVRPVGTAFQLAVWSALREIPFGETRSYGDIARRIGRPGAVRAVGAANGHNPVAIVVPCHRVIGSDGRLTGYGWGVERKAWLLEHEHALPASPPRLL